METVKAAPAEKAKLRKILMNASGYMLYTPLTSIEIETLELLLLERKRPREIAIMRQIPLADVEQIEANIHQKFGTNGNDYALALEVVCFGLQK